MYYKVLQEQMGPDHGTDLLDVYEQRLQEIKDQGNPYYDMVFMDPPADAGWFTRLQHNFSQWQWKNTMPDRNAGIVRFCLGIQNSDKAARARVYYRTMMRFTTTLGEGNFWESQRNVFYGKTGTAHSFDAANVMNDRYYQMYQFKKGALSPATYLQDMELPVRRETMWVKWKREALANGTSDKFHYKYEPNRATTSSQ
mmetsp:Transcript_12794/g.14212  ORF Transcript_12794/g.14212 Transcript_12794/m.14212 type:complete len:198 (-) Transcript_12794:139-732(-)|eukprot:CAMPEP_0168527676 /NCGR_PEP_ID=MMETSP0405-20121227/12757_1 /TAXON_ID=498012 /ORGANISM="Trichosphaerium sp, Strain Am-I-7 wt" /LENGTH=197 /DNA_ID=CAMNT_0008550859 /DNA_START=22 /DNA_END=615 /DNA_ORIENTATION=+